LRYLLQVRRIIYIFIFAEQGTPSDKNKCFFVLLQCPPPQSLPRECSAQRIFSPILRYSAFWPKVQHGKFVDI